MVSPDKVYSLVKTLDAGYRYRPEHMLRFFLSEIMDTWGLEPWEPAPEEIKSQIWDAIGTYSHLVARLGPFEDILGPVYMELASRGAKKPLGQFFTPFSIAKAMAIMTLGPNPGDGSLVRSSDPTCGSGVMLLAFTQAALEQWGSEGLRQVALTGIDLDHYCAQMCAVQLVANCVLNELVLGEVVVLQGNSLGPWEKLRMVLHATDPHKALAVGALSDSGQFPAGGQVPIVTP